MAKIETSIMEFNLPHLPPFVIALPNGRVFFGWVAGHNTFLKSRSYNEFRGRGESRRITSVIEVGVASMKLSWLYHKLDCETDKPPYYRFDVLGFDTPLQYLRNALFHGDLPPSIFDRFCDPWSKILPILTNTKVLQELATAGRMFDKKRESCGI